LSSGTGKGIPVSLDKGLEVAVKAAPNKNTIGLLFQKSPLGTAFSNVSAFDENDYRSVFVHHIVAVYIFLFLPPQANLRGLFQVVPNFIVNQLDESVGIKWKPYS